MPATASVLTEQNLYDYLAAEVFARAVQEREDRVGIEVEFFPLLRARLGTAAAQPLRCGDDTFIGLYPWLLSLAEKHGWQLESAVSSPDLVFVLPGGGRVTLEPGGQVEYSSPPFRAAEDALEDVDAFERLLCREGEPAGLLFVSEGFNGHLGPATVPQLVVEKPRYLMMDRHFEAIGPFGRQMMRQTCATQINLDFGSAGVAPQRWRVANLIAPALNALFANSPHTLHGIRYRSYRHEIWRQTDPCRAGCAVGALGADPVAAYLHFALDATVMFIDRPGRPCTLPHKPMTFRQWMAGEGEPSPPDLRDWQVHLTTLFPHVRPRGFMELRSIDGLPAPARRAAVLLATALIYNQPLRNAALALFEGVEGGSGGQDVTGGPASAAVQGDDWSARFALGMRLLEMAVEVTENTVLRAYLADARRETQGNIVENTERECPKDYEPGMIG